MDFIKGLVHDSLLDALFSSLQPSHPLRALRERDAAQAAERMAQYPGGASDYLVGIEQPAENVAVGLKVVLAVSYTHGTGGTGSATGYMR